MSHEPRVKEITKGSKGRLASGAPARSIKENLVNRGPGERAAKAYVSGEHAAKIPSARIDRPTSGSLRKTDVVHTVTPKRKIQIPAVNAPKRMRSGPRSFSKDEVRRVSAVGEKARWRTAENISYAKTGGSLNYEKDWLKPRRARTTQPNPVGRMAAGKYLKTKATSEGLATIGKKIVTSGAGRTIGSQVLRGAKTAIGGTVGLGLQAAELGTAVLAIHGAKEGERRAKLSTRMLESGMRSRRASPGYVQRVADKPAIPIIK